MTAAPSAAGNVRRLVASGDVLGESPVWDPRTEEVVWIDAHESSALNRLDWRTGKHIRRSLSVRCTAIGLGATPGEYVAALGDGVGIIDRSGSVLSKVALMGQGADSVTNDGACDPAGSFWFGTTTRSRTPLAGSLWRFDGTTVGAVAAGYTLSNGISWLPDASSFFHVDTFEHVVRRDVWDPVGGRLDETVFPGVLRGRWTSRWGGTRYRRLAVDRLLGCGRSTSLLPGREA